jgi:hypothetical protein
MENNRFERSWRELLIKRLSTVQAVLKRDAAAERKKLTEARTLSAGYETVEQAHESYGWGYITWEQYENIKSLLEQDPNTGNISHAALVKLNGYIQGLKDDLIQEVSIYETDAKIGDYFARKEWEKNATD